jgi:hypothetical protein
MDVFDLLEESFVVGTTSSTSKIATVGIPAHYRHVITTSVYVSWSSTGERPESEPNPSVF